MYAPISSCKHLKNKYEKTFERSNVRMFCVCVRTKQVNSAELNKDYFRRRNFMSIF